MTRPPSRGFSLLELLVVIAIIAILTVIAIPSILNALESRNLDTAAREALTTFQSSKFQAVRTKLNHRVRFAQVGTAWTYVVERETTPGVWAAPTGAVVHSVNPKIAVTVTLPSQEVVFNSLGQVENFLTGSNSVTFQSDALKKSGAFDERVLNVYLGGSVQYIRGRST